MNLLVDKEGRRIKKLRLSLTDNCNLRCTYCMPINQTFMDESKFLSATEYLEVLRDLTSMGLEEVRLTGGEPLMRKTFPEILETLSSVSLKKLALTTNGILLHHHWEDLIRAKLWHLNISLDSLQEKTFTQITYRDHLKRVLENINLARNKGFIVKVNMVVMKGVNDHEVMDFIKLSEDLQIEVRFLELMRIGYACKSQTDKFISARALIKRIEWHHELKPVSMPYDSTSFNFVTERGANIGFIASESRPFCGQCSRWRLSADGVLRACLLKDDGLSLKGLNELQRLEVYQNILGMKPSMRPTEVSHPMNLIGG